MKNALEEWRYWEDRRVRMGLKNLEMSKAQIAKKYGLSPLTFGNSMLGKVQVYEHHYGGARQPLVRLGLTICVVKCSYFLVRHRVYKITLLFCVGDSHQSLKVCEVKCIPGDPATMCPVLFKGSAPCCYWLSIA